MHNVELHVEMYLEMLEELCADIHVICICSVLVEVNEFVYVSASVSVLSCYQ